jgi:hypothetical protein
MTTSNANDNSNVNVKQYSWKSGAYIMTDCPEFQKEFALLVAQFGSPERIDDLDRDPVVCKDHTWHINPASIAVVNPYDGMDGYTGHCSRCDETVRLTEEEVTEILDTHDPETVARRKADAWGWEMAEMMDY